MAIKSMRSQGPRIDDSDLARVESEIGVALPSDYRVFLLEFNGGQPTPDGFMFKGGSDGSLVNILFGVGHARATNDVVRVWRGNRTAVPQDLLPIGYDAGGNFICLGLRGERRGRVYFQAADLVAEEDDPWGEEFVWLVADSFAEFIENLSDEAAA